MDNMAEIIAVTATVSACFQSPQVVTSTIDVSVAIVAGSFPAPQVVTSTVDVPVATVTGVFQPLQVANGSSIFVPVLEVEIIENVPTFTAQGIVQSLIATLSATFNVPAVSGDAIAMLASGTVQLLFSVPYISAGSTIEPLSFNATIIQISPAYGGGLTSVFYELAIAVELDRILELVEQRNYMLSLNPEVVINLVQRN